MAYQKPVILARVSPGMMDAEEYAAAKKYFDVVTQRTEVRPGALCIGRYSVLPFYKELCVDLRNQRAKLINNSFMHNYIADLKNWYNDLQGLTPQTWERLENVPDFLGPFVLKGGTNSRKERWRTMMYADNRQEAVAVLLRLQADGLTGNQPIYIRQFEKFKSYGCDPISGIPITHEFRVFVCMQKVVATGFYWQNHFDDEPINGKLLWPTPPQDFLDEVIRRIGGHANFYAVDVALDEYDNWRVVELNDGGMSGLSCIPPEELYGNLYDILHGLDFEITWEVGDV